MELLRPVLRTHRRALLELALWSVLGVVPVVLSGHLIAFAVDRGFRSGDAWTGIAAIGCYGLVLVGGALANRQAVRPMAAVVETLRNHLLRRTVRGSLYQAVLDEAAASTAAVSRITTQVEQVRQLLSGLLLSMSSVGFTFLAAVAGVLTLAPVAGLVMLPGLVLMGLAIARLSRAWRARYDKSLAAEEELGELAGEVLHGFRDVLACDARRRSAAELDRACRADAAASAAVADVGGARAGVLGLGARVPVVLLLLLAPWLISSGGLSAGELLGAATYLVSGLEPALRMLVQTVGNMGLELRSVLDRLAGRSAVPPLPRGGIMALDRYDLAMAGVSFRYGPHSEPVLDRADLEVPYGRHLAVVGPSGIGKSTMVSVLAGLEPVEAGEVRLGGVPLTCLREPWLRATIALIPQQAYVFSGSLRENLRYLAPESTSDDLDRAVLALGMGELVRAHGGLDGRVRPDQLSQGERQLIALARVYLSRARVVILDEATCHLDAGAEERVERAFARRGGTLVVVAHRISSALRADRVLLLDRGGLRTGTHGTLLRSSATYANLVGAWNAVA